MKTQTKGNKVTINFGSGRNPTFTAGGRKRHLISEEYDGIGHIAVNGMVRFNDGTEAYAVLVLDESSSGEHSGTGIFLPCGDFAWQNDDDFLKQIGKRKSEVYPYNYKYTGTVRTNDHHIGEDGWSQ